MSSESGWKGRIGALVPASYWQRAIKLIDNKTPTSTLSIAELRRSQAEAFKKQLPGVAHRVEWQAGSAQLHVGTSESDGLRARLLSLGYLLVPMAKDALAPGAVAGWSCATKAQVGRRTDLAEAIGIRLVVESAGDPAVKRNVLEVTEPIDIVYTWVDGADPYWQAQRIEAESALAGELPPTSNDRARYDSHDELRYSLRSVEAFLPWVNHIYVVTAGQRPAWLNESNPRITVIDHKEIFKDPAALPTFNSHAIESQLHRVPGLSDRFLYVNDDVFFGRLLGQQVFYTPTGYPKFALSNERFDVAETENLPVNIAAQNNSRLLEAKFGKSSAHKFKHAAHAQLKRTLTTIVESHPIESGRTANARFRSGTDLSIPSALAHYYGCALGEAFPSEIDYSYIDLGSEQVHVQLAKLFLQTRPQMFCINEVSADEGDLAERTSNIRHALQHVFPWASSFETVGRRNDTYHRP